MTLSIITINLNNRNGLKRTIDSVINQTFTDYEWIVIDGGSTDGSKELIEQYSDLFAYWVSEPDKGIYNAMNKGIAHAHGDWLQFLNSGDWLFENTTIEKVFSKEYDADVLYGDVTYVNPTNAKVVRVESKPDNIDLFFFYHNTLCHQASFYRKNVFFNSLYDESFSICGDIAFNIHLLICGHKMHHIPLCIVNFEEGGMGAIFNQKHIDERKRMYEEYVPEYLQKDMLQLLYYDKKKNYYNSHRLYKAIMRFAEFKIKLSSKFINLCERIRLKITR